MRRFLPIAGLIICAAVPARAEPAPGTLDGWIIALRCRELPTFDARMACYLAAAKLLDAPAKSA